MRYPLLQYRSCSSCQDLWYEDREGPISGCKILMIGQTGKPRRRPPNSKPPCERCIKENPSRGVEIENELPRARQNLQLYWQNKASNGALLATAIQQDAVLAENMGTIEEIVQGQQADTNAKGMAGALLPLMTLGMGRK